MKYLNNKYIRIFISILLVLVISINFAYKPYAFALELGIAVKVFAVILGSMGILTVINNNGGVESFYEGFKDFMAMQKNITDTQLRLYQMGVTAIYNNAKMKVSFWANSIKEFYNIFKANLVQEVPPVILPNLRFYCSGSYAGTDPGSQGVVFHDVISDLPEAVGYTFKVTYSRNGNASTSIRAQLLYNGGIVTTHEKLIYGHLNGVSEHEFITSYSVQFNDEKFIFTHYTANITTNKDATVFKEYDVGPLVGLKDVRYNFDSADDIPVALPVPLGLTFPWERLESISGYFGDTVDNLIASISAIDIGTLVAELELLRRQGINTVPPAIIVGTPETVGEDGQISGDTVVEDIVVGEPIIGDFESVEQTGLLTSALGVLGGILAFLKDIFSVPDDLELDIDPLKDLPLLTKFPFSLPWDYKNIISNFITDETKAPSFDIDFPIEVSAVNWSQDVKINVDFEQFTQLANIVRVMLSFIFILGLIILTRTFIGGA